MPDKTAQIDLAYALNLKPEKAIEYFKSKGYALTWDWFDLWQSAHSRSFTVAKAMRLDILQDIRDMVQKALDEGITFDQFRKELEPRLKAKGWWGRVMVGDDQGAQEVQLGSPWRLKTIYRTNLQTSYMTGRYRTMMENVDDRPYWQYVAVLDRRTRPTHRALNGQVFRYDDPFWETHYPPLGFNCRCRVRALAGGDIKERGLVVENSEGRLVESRALVSKKTGEVVPVTGFKTHDPMTGKLITVAPDPGWNYNPGKAEHQLDISAWAKVKKLPAEVRKQFIDEMAHTDTRDHVFSQWVNEVVKKPKLSNQGKTTTAGWLSNDVIGWLAENKKIQVVNPVIVAIDKKIVHAERDAKTAPVELGDLRKLPQTLRNPEAILFDNTLGSLLYISTAKDGLKNKFVVELNYSLKKIGVINNLITAGKVNTATLKDKNRYVLIMGRLENN